MSRAIRELTPFGADRRRYFREHRVFKLWREQVRVGGWNVDEIRWIVKADWRALVDECFFGERRTPPTKPPKFPPMPGACPPRKRRT